MEVLKMLEKQQKFGIFGSQKSGGFLRNHFCEFEVAGELVFCTICGKTAEVMSE
jgi:hypothetical protein